MNRSVRISYALVVLLLVLIVWLHLGTLLLTTLFGYLALNLFCFRRNKPLSVLIYLVVVAVIVSGLVYFAGLAYHTLPRIAETSIPAMTSYAEKNGVQLPFSDFESLKSAALGQAEEGIAVIGRYAWVASLQFVLLLAGLVVAISLFLNSSWTATGAPPVPGVSENLYDASTRELSLRFRSLYQSFSMVIGAQIVIAAINTVLTAIFLLFNGYPYTPLLIVFVFLCGLLPVVGNLISNTLIVGVGFTLSPHTGIYALIFLVVIHKLEYFLNSKIVGKRINSPMWLTLIGLIVGERLMGITGMILAPVLLHFLKVEVSRYRASAVVESDPQS
jgi:predicted PurR-regulated permease PerM